MKALQHRGTARYETPDRAAMMLCFCAWRPLILDLACCSLRMMKGRPYSSKTMDMVAFVAPRSGLSLSKAYLRAAKRDDGVQRGLLDARSAAEGFDCWLASVRWQR